MRFKSNLRDCWEVSHETKIETCHGMSLIMNGGKKGRGEAFYS